VAALAGSMKESSAALQSGTRNLGIGDSGVVPAAAWAAGQEGDQRGIGERRMRGSS